MKKTTLLAPAGVLFTGLVLIVASSMGGAQDKKTSGAVPDKPGTATVAAKATPLAEFPIDSVFDRYFNRKVLAKAWADLNADLLTDLALELAEGERVLLRQHKGISADEMRIVATRVAVFQKDEPALQRLTKAANARGDKQWQTRLQALQKLAAASADAKLEHSVSVDKISPAQFSKHHGFLHAIKRAALTGDRSALDQIQAQLASAHILTKDQKECLQQRIKSQQEAMSATPDKSVADIMAKLTAASRTDYSFSQWSSRYTFPGVPPVNAYVTLQGNSGSYSRDDGSTGSLYNINYSGGGAGGPVPPGGPLGPGGSGTVTITGNWSLGGDTGTFVWHVVPNGSQFVGTWYGPAGTGAWNGSNSFGGSGGPLQP